MSKALIGVIMENRKGSRSPKRQSILKMPADAEKDESRKRKRLSFYEPLTYQQGQDASRAESPSVNAQFRLSEDLKMTEFGLCYIPMSPKELDDDTGVQNLDLDNNVDKRLDFRRLLNYRKSEMNVMIVGEETITSGFLKELLKVTDSSLHLNCTCKSFPTAAESLETDFFLFLFELSSLTSIHNLQERIQNMGQPLSQLCFRSALVAVSAFDGFHNNAISSEELHSVSVDLQMPNYVFNTANSQLKNGCVSRIYDKIKLSRPGNSLSLLFNWGLTCPVRNTELLLS